MSACHGAGSRLLLRGLLLQNALLPSGQLVNSGLAAPAPLAFNLSSGSLVLDSCTVSTSCSNLAQFASWVSGQPSVNASQVCVCVSEVCMWGVRLCLMRILCQVVVRHRWVRNLNCMQPNP